MLADFFAVVAQTPDPPGVEVAVNVRSHEFRQALAAINKPAGKRTKIGVRVFDDRRQDRRRPFLAFGPEWVCSLLNAPAVVPAFFNLVDHLPQVLAHLACPQVAGLTVEAVLPRLPEPVGP